MSELRVAVDADKCIGSGICEMLEEAVFAVDDDKMIASVAEGVTLSPDRAARVIDQCPASAISVIE